MFDYEVDVIIPVHSVTRPIARAVRSVVEGTKSQVRISVVAHNIDPEIIRNRLGEFAIHPQVRLLELKDDIPSPSGPMNLGLAQATAPFTVLLGSDDELEVGAIDSWLAVQRSCDADVVLAKIHLANGSIDPYPPVRNARRTHDLRGSLDRLSYRSAPLGLVSRKRFPELRMAEGVRSGEDLPYSLTLWFTGKNLAYDLHGPAYLVNGDAEDRVTADPRGLQQDFAFLECLEALPWLTSASRNDRQAIAVKLIRMHYFDAVRAHVEAGWSRSTPAEFKQLLSRLESLAPGVLELLSQADHRVIDAIHAADTIALPELVNARQRYVSLGGIVTKNPLRILHRQAPLRTYFSAVRIQRRG